eukprot:CAMPEP_0197889490 /NCGR_PEP_ID=MMETSP1439-20131203/24370_1 /TAXON_ID=66791 /ORGANISM="Gonyaulax spinifera, Strain CCMP409" /LENGTH=47 /DNA_ID= /DNA_START= /DNA_END= /DNA_ORIENTATION=
MRQHAVIIAADVYTGKTPHCMNTAVPGTTPWDFPAARGTNANLKGPC